MSIVKDLKPNEIELTMLCPVGACLVQHTWAFNDELQTSEAHYKRLAKENMTKLITEAHSAGKHKTGELVK